MKNEIVRIWNWPNGHRCAFIIRDDDASAFTKPWMLEKIYESAWKKGFKLSLSIVPLIGTSNLPNIPPAFRNMHVHKVIDENSELINYLSDKIEKGYIDVAQHGLTHEKVNSKAEFETLNYQEAKERLLRGSKLIQTALNVEPQVFVAPWERISKEAASAMVDCGYSYNSLVKPGHTKVPSKLPYPVPSKLGSSSLFIPRSLSLFSRFYSIDENIKRIKDQILYCYGRRGCAVLTAHYWEFFHDWADFDSHFIEEFNNILNFVENLNVWKTSLSSVADWWLRKEKIVRNKLSKR